MALNTFVRALLNTRTLLVVLDSQAQNYGTDPTLAHAPHHPFEIC
jgi:hypothetical protein